ncbi:hypothetical protein A1OW_14370 [Enterovibrio norvegicus]|uniref:Uncharacterized protein n=2 Tax=Enterovibrio norvegicus TaxID=188144 RepID=A0A1I5NKG8_9GAMM|nr:hypothetical protein [Enterovibrio norvegicus]OEF48746.1 hypothetical protein A1OW_14370 [Enterovibrio norvegicus]OEF55157.1 hypothetical protein A1OU_22515 [Enterovibrio norvegicus]SFP22293.1 hypothetical protein SAMN03084138_01630 [Enterovibrio norvegicus DSM 15893]
MNVTIAFFVFSISVFMGVLALPWQQHLMSGQYQHFLVQVLHDGSTTTTKGQTRVDGNSIIHVATIKQSLSEQTSLVRLTGYLKSTLYSYYLLRCDVELVYVDHLDNTSDFLFASSYLFFEDEGCHAKLGVVYEDPEFLIIKDYRSEHTQIVTRL